MGQVQREVAGDGEEKRNQHFWAPNTTRASHVSTPHCHPSTSNSACETQGTQTCWLNWLNHVLSISFHLCHHKSKQFMRSFYKWEHRRNILDVFVKLLYHTHNAQKIKAKLITYMIVFCSLYQLFYHWLQLTSRHCRYHHGIKQGCQFTHLFFTAIHQTLSGVERNMYMI